MHNEYLRTGAVLARYGISRTTLYARIKDGFPQPIQLMGGRCVVWKLAELVAYEEACAARRGGSDV